MCWSQASHLREGDPRAVMSSRGHYLVSLVQLQFLWSFNDPIRFSPVSISMQVIANIIASKHGNR